MRILILLCLLSINAYGQHCRYSSGVTEAGKEEGYISTEQQTISNIFNESEKKIISFSLFKFNNIKQMDVSYTKIFHKDTSFLVTDGKIVITLSNDSIVTLSSAMVKGENGYDWRSHSDQITPTKYRVSVGAIYHLKPNEIALLSKFKITNVRIYTSKFYDDFPVEPILKGSLEFPIKGKKKIDPQSYFINTLDCIK